MNWRRHLRFLLALLAGTLAAILAPMAVSAGVAERILLGGNLFFGTYLLLAMLLARRTGIKDLRRKGAEDDEGGPWILALAVGVIVLSLSAVIGVLIGRPEGDLLLISLAVMIVPLGWATLHVVMAFHYASYFYNSTDGTAVRGLAFPGDSDPGIWDFIYFSFTLGMAAQTSDVAITSPALRRIATLHSVLSFFFNTVILALAVNAAVSLG